MTGSGGGLANEKEFLGVEESKGEILDELVAPEFGIGENKFHLVGAR